MQEKRLGQPTVEPSVEAWDLGKTAVPFPALSVTIPASEEGSKTKKLCQASQKKQTMTTICHTEQLTGASAPIPFPKAHVKKTPSEIQIDLNRRQAEYDVALMTARIDNHSRTHDHPSTFLTRNPKQKQGKEKKAGMENQLAPTTRCNAVWDLAYSSNTTHSLKSRESAKHHTRHKLEGGDDDDDDNDDIFRLDL